MSKKQHKSKRAKKKRGPKKAKPIIVKKAATNNGRDIQALAMKVGWDPNKYKDYVALVGTRLVDWKDNYNLSSVNGANLNPNNEVILIHKSKLHNMLPAQMADLFWHRALGRRVVKAGPSLG